MRSKPAADAADVKKYQSTGADEALASRSTVPPLADSAKGPVAANPSSTSSSRISKCLVNGRTMYSNDGCPDGAKQQAVALHDSAGIVSPPKENLSDLTAKRRASERAYALQAQAQVTAISLIRHSRHGFVVQRRDVASRHSPPI
jgi:hypothetical protein